MLNRTTIMGRLTRDPELRRTGDGVAVCSFTLAVDRDFVGRDGGEREADFIDFVAWRQNAEFLCKFFKKGKAVVVDGRLQSRKWTDKENNRRRSVEVLVENVYFGDSRRDGARQSGEPQGEYGGEAGDNGMTDEGEAPAENFAEMEGADAQLPF